MVVNEQEREDEALYCDAHVVNIKRGVHDHRSCNCVFFVRYEFDGTEVNSLISAFYVRWFGKCSSPSCVLTIYGQEPLGVECICRRPEE